MQPSGPSVDRLPTGIPGLDTILSGGLFRGGLYLVRGDPGSGKTILSNQILFHQLGGGGRALYIGLLSETVSRLLAYLRGFPFLQLDAVGDAVVYLSGSSATTDADVGELLTLIRQTIRDRAITFLVLDGLVTVEAMQPGNALALKQFIRNLQVLAESTGCTALVLQEDQRTPTPFDSVVDGIFDLHDVPTGGLPARSLTVAKVRGTDYLRGAHPFLITDAGVVVYPRLDSLFAIRPPVPPGPPVPLGLPALDLTIGGGLPRTSTTLVCGPSGCGKTTLGWQFLVAGAAAGEGVLYVSLTEPPEAVAARMAGRIAPQGAEGAIGLHRHPWGTQQFDILGHELLHLIRGRPVERLVIDGIPAGGAALHPPTLAALRTALEREGVTSLWTVTYPSEAGAGLILPAPELVTLTDALLALRLHDAPPTLQRLLTVVKLPHGPAATSTVRLLLGPEGLTTDSFDR